MAQSHARGKPVVAKDSDLVHRGTVAVACGGKEGRVRVGGWLSRTAAGTLGSQPPAYVSPINGRSHL